MVSQAVILAAGSGRRLRPLTDDRPKCLVPIAGTTLLDRLLGQLVRAGIERVVIVTGYMAARLAQHLAENPPPLDMTLVENERYLSTENSASLLCARAALGERGFVLCDGDVVLRDGPIDDLVAADGSALLVDPHVKLAREEMKIAVRDGRIVALSKELEPHAADGESIGIQKVEDAATPALWAELEAMMQRGRQGGYYEEAFQGLIDRGHVFRPVVMAQDSAMEIDDLDDLARARARFAP